jgi:hypothetical protein
VPQRGGPPTATLYVAVGYRDVRLRFGCSRKTGCRINDLVITRQFVEQVEPEALRAELLRHIDEGVRAIHVSLTLPLREPVRCIAHRDTPDLEANEFSLGIDPELTTGATRPVATAGMPFRLTERYRLRRTRVLARWLGLSKHPVSDSPS